MVRTDQSKYKLDLYSNDYFFRAICWIIIIKKSSNLSRIWKMLFHKGLCLSPGIILLSKEYFFLLLLLNFKRCILKNNKSLKTFFPYFIPKLYLVWWENELQICVPVPHLLNYKLHEEFSRSSTYPATHILIQKCPLNLTFKYTHYFP